MLRVFAALALAFMALSATGAPADACAFCVDSVSLQTRDGQPWTAGKPVTLVIAASSAAGATLPANGVAVVMQTDGDRTKCLEVPLRLVNTDGTTGQYAGVFFPFRAAKFDGKLAIGDDVSDLTFDVNKMVGGAAPAGDLPAAEPLDTSASPLTFVASSQLVPLTAAALGFWALIVIAFHGRRRLVRQVA
jgi:hypothetical protein